MKSKHGALGEGVLMIYRLLLVSLIALVILGISSVFYSHYIDVRKVEAMVMEREIVNCLAGKGILEYDKFNNMGPGNLLNSCGYKNGVERFYVSAKIVGSDGKEIGRFYEGDSGKLWIKKFYDTANIVSSEAVKRAPGYINEEYEIYFLKDGKKSFGKLEMEVLVNEE